MAFSWTNTVPVAGDTIHTSLPLEIRLKLDTLINYTCATHNTTYHATHLTAEKSSIYITYRTTHYAIYCATYQGSYNGGD